MSGVFFLSDLHLGHKNVTKFENHFRAKAMGIRPCSLDEAIKVHDRLIIDRINETVDKRSKLYLLGDIGYNTDLLHEIECKTVTMVLGNHDTKGAEFFISKFGWEVLGAHAYKGFWISHFPIHPDELYGKRNIHGHVHCKSVKDDRYINISVEMNGGYPVSFEDIKSGKYKTGE